MHRGSVIVPAVGSPRTVVIVNPRSQGGAAGRDWPSLADRIRRALPFEEAITAAPGDATRLAREALRAGAERVVALGGDGTINEVANGFFTDGAAIAPEAALGILPYGTGGDFRKSAGVPRDFDAAVRLLAADRRRRIDVGRLDHATGGGGRATRVFVNIASFGMSGVVDRLVNESRKRFGKLSFLIASTRGMFRYDNQPVRLTFDDSAADSLEMTINTVAVANGRYFGGGMHIAPEAELDDGRFDVVAIGDVGIKELVLGSRRLYQGTHLTLDHVSHRRARVVHAEPARPGGVVELDVDGETPGRLPATFTVLPGALALVAPAPW
jgi:diacylglycerol kinase (ATP)